MTEELYAEISAKQAQQTAYEIVDELIDGTGSYGKAIIQHIKSGGNPDEIIDLFKEQKALEQIDTSTEEGKQVKIEKYYRDILGWKPEKVKRQINRLIENNEIDTEFADVDELYEKHYSDKLAETQKHAQEREQEVRRKQLEFKNKITDVIDNNSNYSEEEKKLIKSSILDLRHKYGGCKRYSESLGVKSV